MDYVKPLRLRIHHFYDIIRDFSKKEAILPHPYGHSYHKVAALIWENSELEIEIIVDCDDICTGCEQLKNDTCEDLIDHRKDFVSKHSFNNFIDYRIMEACLIQEGNTLTPNELCRKAKLYLEEIDWVYKGNDPDHTEKRKMNVLLGLSRYSQKHQFDIS